jgi:peptidyl-prolyl cis-trans isomerase SurA
MVKEIFMKRLLILCLLFVCVVGNAQITADSIIMTVAGKQIPLDEFLFIAQKNSEVDLSDRKSVENYVELFKNFKLKVAEAEAQGLNQTKTFKDDLERYRSQLTSTYLSDKEGEEVAVRMVYERN